MKTPIQILISELEEGLKQDEIKVSPKELIQNLIWRCNGLLEKEKEVMLKYGNDICCPHHGDENDALYVWNQTFNTQEK